MAETIRLPWLAPVRGHDLRNALRLGVCRAPPRRRPLPAVADPEAFPFLAAAAPAKAGRTGKRAKRGRL